MSSPEWIVITLAVAIVAGAIGIALGWSLCSATRLIARAGRRYGDHDNGE